MPENKTLTAVGIIPARLDSTRLREKMLADLCGKPLIVWTATSAMNSGAFSRVIVATDHERIAGAVTDAGFDAIMTDSDLPSGSARVAAVARNIEADIIVNIQGDEPLADPEGLRRLVNCFQDYRVKMATLAFPLAESDESNPNVVKTVLDRNNDALYFSRSLIPFPRSRDGFSPLKHIGVYGYRKETLMSLMELEPCAIEKIESLEQLRALYHGIRIRVLLAQDSIGVDTAEDLERVRAELKRRKT